MLVRVLVVVVIRRHGIGRGMRQGKAGGEAGRRLMLWCNAVCAPLGNGLALPPAWSEVETSKGARRSHDWLPVSRGREVADEGREVADCAGLRSTSAVAG